MKEEVQRWLKQAEDDLSSAIANIGIERYYVASFLAQQAAEKALKALLIKQGKGLIKMHNLIIMGKKANLPDELIKKCDALNAVYTETRYPDAVGPIPSEKFTLEMAEDDAAIAKEVLAWLKNKI